MNHHKIEVGKLLEWKDEYKAVYASSYSPRNNKKLCATLNGGFEVWHNNVKVYECIQAYLAVEIYNNILIN